MMQRKHEVAKRDAGFTLIEVMISMVVLVIGLVSLLALITYAVSTMQLAQEDLIAKNAAKEGLESVYSARNDGFLGWSAIQNIANGGVFDSNFDPLCQMGSDGLINTTNYFASPSCVVGPENLILPGPDGVIGTADDITIPLSNFQRQIQINNTYLPSGALNPSLRQIIVTVQYSTPQFGQRQYSITSLISQYK